MHREIASIERAISPFTGASTTLPGAQGVPD
jgi:hypothetical protein